MHKHMNHIHKIVSKIINAFAMNSFFVYFSPLKLSMFYLPILLDLILFYLKSLFIPIEQKRNYLESMTVTECQKTCLTSEALFLNIFL